MNERIKAVETRLPLDHTIGDQYDNIVKKANTMRMLYASHHMKRRDSVLPIIRDMLISTKEQELILLTDFVDKIKGGFGS